MFRIWPFRFVYEHTAPQSRRQIRLCYVFDKNSPKVDAVIRIRFKQLLDDKEFRERRRITLDEVAAATGISRTTLHRVSNVAGYNTGTDTIDALCEYFGCDPAALVVRVRE